MVSLLFNQDGLHYQLYCAYSTQEQLNFFSLALTRAQSFYRDPTHRNTMKKSASNFITTLNSHHYVTVPFVVPRSDLEIAANHFLEFLKLPDRIKRQLHFPARSHRASADGFTDKVGVDLKDPKQFFHWSPMLLGETVCKQLRTKYSQIDSFFQTSESLYREIEYVLSELYFEHLPEYRHHVFRGNQLIDGILRFLCYTPRDGHSFCARAHFDKGFSTLAIADSAPGLRIGCCNRHPLEPVRYQEGTAIFMPAWMLFQASKGHIKPAWHDVIHAPQEQDVNELCARWSIVFFVNNPASEFCSWESAHTPLH